MNEDLSILLKAQLDVNKSINNINKQILEVQDKLETVNISLSLGSVEQELKSMMDNVEKAGKKVSGQDIKFGSLQETSKEIKSLSKNLEDVYADLKKIGNVKSLKNIYDDNGNVKGFSVQLENVKNGLKEISNYNAIGKFNKETQEWEYGLNRVTSTIKEVTKETEKIGKSDNQKAYYDNLMKYVHMYKLELISVNDYIKKLSEIMYSSKGGYAGQFTNRLGNKEQEFFVKELNNALKQQDKILEDISKTNKAIENDDDKRLKALNNQSLAMLKMKNALDNTNGKYSSNVDSEKSRAIYAQLDALSKLNPQTAEYEMRLKQIQMAVGVYNKELANSVVAEDKHSKAIVDKTIAIDKIKDKMKSMKSLYGSYVDMSKFNGINKMISDLKKLDPLSVEYRNNLKKIQYETDKLGNESKQAFKKLEDSISDTTGKTSQLGLAMRTLGQLFMVGSPIHLAQRVFRDMATSINELNKATTDIRLVTGMSAESVEELKGSYNQLGKEIGATTQEILNSSTEWYRQGKTIAETEELVKASMIGSKLGKIESAQMTEYLTSSLNGYLLSSDKAISVIDKLVSVDLKAATSTAELAEAMSRTSSSARMVGVDIDTLIGYIGTVSSVTRKSAETIGESFKTIFSRYQNIKLGKFVEDGVVTSDVISAMDNVKIAVKDGEESFRDFGLVIDDLSKKWHTLTDAEKSSVANALAGVRQRENFIVLMDNYSKSVELAKISTESAGEAVKMFGVWSQGTEAILNKFKVTAESVFMETLSSNTVNNIINIGTAMLELVSNVGGLVPILTSIVSLIALLNTQKLTSMFIGMSLPIKGMVSGFTNLKIALVNIIPALQGLAVGTTTVRTAMAFAIPIVTALSVAIGALMLGVNAYNKAQEEKVRIAKENKSIIESELSETKKLLSRYEEINKSGKNNSETKKELLEIQKQLAEYHGVEINKLDLVKKSYEENIAVMEEAIKTKRRYLEIDNDTITKDLENNLNKAMNNKITGSVYEFNGDNGIGEAFRNLEKDIQDIFNVNTSGRSFKITIKPEVDEKEALKAMDELLEAMELQGLKGSDSYGSLANTYKDLSNAIEELNNVKEDGLRIDAQNKVDDITKDIGDVTKATKEQYEVLKQNVYDEYTNTLAEASINEKELGYAMEILNKMFPQFADNVTESDKSLNSSNASLEDYNNNIGELSVKIEQSESNMALLSSATDELSSTQQLSKDTIAELINKYPELISKVEEVNGTYRISKEELDNLMDSEINESNTAIQANISKTKAVLNETLARIGLNKQEISSIKTLMQAYALLGQLQQQAIQQSMVDTRSDVYVHGGWAKTAFDTAQSDLKQKIGDAKVAVGLMRELESLENKAFNLVGGSSSKGKEGGSKSSKSSKSEQSQYIKSMYQSMVESILNGGKEVEKEIDKTNLAIEKAILMGDDAAELKQSNKLSELFKQERDKQAEMAKQLDEQLNSMRNDLSKTGMFKDMDLAKLDNLGLDKVVNDIDKKLQTANDKEKERLEGLKSVITDVGDVYISTLEKREDLSQIWHEKEIQCQQQEIDNIERKYELVRKGFELDKTKLNIEKMLVDENDFEAMEGLVEKEMSIIAKEYEVCLDKIRALREQGLMDTQEAIEAEKNLYLDLYAQQINLSKQLGEQRRKEKLDSLKIEQEKLQEQQKATQDLLKLTMDMLKQRYEEEKKLIQDNLKETEDAIKAELDAKKKLIKDEIDGYKKIIDAKKKALQDERDDKNYQKGLSEKEKNIKKVEDKLLSMSNDNSLKAQAEKKKLEEELLKYKEELDDYQYDHSVDKQLEALDDEYNRYEESKNKELEAYEEAKNKELEAFKKQKEEELKVIEEKTSKENNIRKEAMEYLRSEEKSAYDDLLSYALEYTDTSQNSFDEMWGLAQEAIDNYSGSSMNLIDIMSKLAEEMKRVADESERIQNSSWKEFVEEESYNKPSVDKPSERPDDSSNGNNSNNNKPSVGLSEKGKQQKSQQAYLHDLMIKAKEENNKQLIAWIKAERKKWDLNEDTGAVMKQWHTGLLQGRVGDGLKPNEIIAKLTKDEYIFTGDQFGNLNKNITNLLSGGSKTPTTIEINIEKVMDVANIDKGVDIRSLVSKATDEMYKSLNATFKLNGFRLR